MQKYLQQIGTLSKGGGGGAAPSPSLNPPLKSNDDQYFRKPIIWTKRKPRIINDNDYQGSNYN